MRKALKYLMIAAVALLQQACRHKDLCYGHDEEVTVRVQFHWDLTEARPAAMRVYFYPIDNADRTLPYVYDFANSIGGTVTLPQGHYQVTCFNIDTDNIFQRGDNSLLTLELYTPERTLSGDAFGTVPQPVSSKGMQLYDTPNWICRDMKDNIDIPLQPDGSEFVIDMHPKMAVYEIRFEVHGIQGLNFVHQMKGTLTGVAPSLFAATGQLPADPAAVVFDAGQRDGVVVGSFYVFDRTPGYQQQELTLYFWSDDVNVYASFDVSDQIADGFARAGTDRSIPVIPIIIQDVGINIEKYIDFSGEGGFSIDVDGWTTVEIEVPLS